MISLKILRQDHRHHKGVKIGSTDPATGKGECLWCRWQSVPFGFSCDVGLFFPGGASHHSRRLGVNLHIRGHQGCQPTKMKFTDMVNFLSRSYKITVFCANLSI